MPAMMKGWLDRVLAYQRTYSEEQNYNLGHFCNKKAMLSLTTGEPAGSYTEDGAHGEINAVLKPLQQGVLAFLGFQVLEPFVAYQPGQLTEQVRINMLEQFSDRLRHLEQEQPILQPAGCDL